MGTFDSRSFDRGRSQVWVQLQGMRVATAKIAQMEKRFPSVVDDFDA